jgi:hypothetical protein
MTGQCTLDELPSLDESPPLLSLPVNRNVLIFNSLNHWNVLALVKKSIDQAG